MSNSKTERIMIPHPIAIVMEAAARLGGSLVHGIGAWLANDPDARVRESYDAMIEASGRRHRRYPQSLLSIGVQ
jgi:hypothetical protein